MSQQLERRHTQQSRARVQVRADGDKRTIEGYAAVFFREGQPETEYELWSDVYERIMPGAFDRAIKEMDDARGLFNHDSSLILGRVSAGTCRLKVDQTGLHYEIDAPDTQCGRDTLVSIERKDITGSSFAFIPTRTVWIEEENRDIRQIEEVRLFDVGPVTYPAYEGTTTNARDGHSTIEQELHEWRASKVNDADGVAARLKMLKVDEVLY